MPCVFLAAWSWWWVVPVVVLAMVACMFLAMRACSGRARAGGGGIAGCCGPGRASRDGALDVQRRRYAEGELTKEELGQMKGQVTP